MALEPQYIDPELNHLKPPPEANNVHHSQQYIHKIKPNNYHVRKIFYNVKYTDYENQKIDEFEAELKKRNIPFPENWDRAKSLKYCLTGQMVLEDSITIFQNHCKWLNDVRYQKFTPFGLELAKKGLVYECGRDHEYRPVIYMNMKMFDQNNRLDEQLHAISNICVRITKYMYLKGKIENFIVILDLTGISVWKIPVDVISKIKAQISLNFTCQLHRMYLLNPPTIVKMGFSIIKSFMVEETASKLQMLAESEYSKLQECIPPSQLQKKYGGNLPNLTKFWPPENLDHLMPGANTAKRQNQEINLNGENVAEIEMQQQNMNGVQSQSQLQLQHQDSEYFSIVNDSQHFFSEDFKAEKEFPKLQNYINKDIDIREDNKELQITNGEGQSSCCTCQIF